MLSIPTVARIVSPSNEVGGCAASLKIRNSAGFVKNVFHADAAPIFATTSGAYCVLNKSRLRMSNASLTNRPFSFFPLPDDSRRYAA